WRNQPNRRGEGGHIASDDPGHFKTAVDRRFYSHSCASFTSRSRSSGWRTVMCRFTFASKREKKPTRTNQGSIGESHRGGIASNVVRTRANPSRSRLQSLIAEAFVADQDLTCPGSLNAPRCRQDDCRHDTRPHAAADETAEDFAAFSGADFGLS